jgi:hypothetical protein
MSISNTPAPARTDATAVSTTRGDLTADPVRRTGVVLAACTATWAVANLALGFEPDSESAIKTVDLTGLVFQVGIMALLHLQMRTRATGPKRISARLLRVERVLLSIAMVWSVAHALLPDQRDAAWMGVLDMFWPLSMLGMFFIGVKVFFAQRWRGKARVWSLLAETWAPMTVPLMGILGHDGGGDLIGGLHLLLGYTTLGVILAARPDLVRDELS